MKKLAACLLVGTGIVSASLLFSEEFQKENKQPSLLSVGVGVFGFDKPKAHPLFQLQYMFSAEYYTIRPIVGILATTRGSVYGYGGMAFDFRIGKHVAIVPSFAPGIYIQGHGKNLGFPIEFRSCLELAYRFNNEGRLSAQIYHMSNASLSHRNPGANSIVLCYSFPIY